MPATYGTRESDEQVGQDRLQGDTSLQCHVSPSVQEPHLLDDARAELRRHVVAAANRGGSGSCCANATCAVRQQCRVCECTKDAQDVSCCIQHQHR